MEILQDLVNVKFLRLLPKLTPESRRSAAWSLAMLYVTGRFPDWRELNGVPVIDITAPEAWESLVKNRQEKDVLLKAYTECAAFVPQAQEIHEKRLAFSGKLKW